MANGWSSNGTRFCIRWKIDVAELNKMLIFHLMCNLVPLHESIPFAICVVQHLEYYLNWIGLIRISYLGWVKFHSFSSPWPNLASARPTRNMYCIHKTISVRDTIVQIHTNMQCKVIVTSCALLQNGTKLHDCAMVWSAARSAPIGLYTTTLLGVVQMLLTFDLWPHLNVEGLHSWVLDQEVMDLLPDGCYSLQLGLDYKQGETMIMYKTMLFLYITSITSAIKIFNSTIQHFIYCNRQVH